MSTGMRIAVVNQFSSAGGGSRFARALVMGLAKADPSSHFDFFADARAVTRDGLVDLFAGNANVRIRPLEDGAMVDIAQATSVTPVQAVRAWALSQALIVRAYRWLKFDILRRPDIEPSSMRLPDATLRVLDGYDVVYLAWPYFIEPPAVTAPVVATFHDFNFKHGFGNFSESMLADAERDMLAWLESPVQPVSSTRFIADELRAFYPTHHREPAIVFLSSFAVHDPGPSEVRAVREKYGLPQDYVICPSNTSPHKNLVGLMRALGILKREGCGVATVLSGFGTDDLVRLAQGNSDLHAKFDAAFALHDARIEEKLVLGEDVFALGFVSDFDMDALIRGARAVVAPSRYEAGSGPALDAWKLGTLVVSSDIPPVLEQLAFLGTAAYLFNPDEPSDIARAVRLALSDSDAAGEMIEKSSAAMDAYTWVDVGRAYLAVLREAISGDSGASL